MTRLPISSVLAGVPVRDLDISEEWFARLFGSGPDERPMDGLIEWRFPDNQTFQVVLDPDRAGGGIVTLHVPDIADVQARLAEANLPLDVDAVTSTKVKFGTIVDPDGNGVTFVEALAGFDPSGQSPVS